MSPRSCSILFLTVLLGAFFIGNAFFFKEHFVVKPRNLIESVPAQKPLKIPAVESEVSADELEQIVENPTENVPFEPSFEPWRGSGILLWNDESPALIHQWFCNFRRATLEPLGRRLMANETFVITIVARIESNCNLLNIVPEWPISIRCLPAPGSSVSDLAYFIEETTRNYDSAFICVPQVIFLSNFWEHIQNVYAAAYQYSAGSVFAFSLTRTARRATSIDPIPALFILNQDSRRFSSMINAVKDGAVTAKHSLPKNRKSQGPDGNGLPGWNQETLSVLSQHLEALAFRERLFYPRFEYLRRVSFASLGATKQCFALGDDLGTFSRKVDGLIAIYVSSKKEIDSNYPGLEERSLRGIPDTTCIAGREFTIFSKTNPSSLLARAAQTEKCSSPVGSAIAEDLMESEQELIKLAHERASPSRTILLLVSNHGFLPFLFNFLCWYQQVQFQPEASMLTASSYVIAALDVQAYDKLRSMNLPVFYSGAPVESTLKETGSYKSQQYNEIVKKKPLYTHMLLRSGLNVFLADLDLVLYSDPTLFVKPSTDMLISEDDKAEWGRNLNTGFVFFRSRPCVVDVLKGWLAENERVTGAEDQRVFNSIVENFVSLNIDSIPRGRYLSFPYRTGKCRCISAELEPVVVHWNWIDGSMRKKMIMRQWGEWIFQNVDDTQIRCKPPLPLSCSPPGQSRLA